MHWGIGKIAATILLALFLVLVWRSVWLKGRPWFIATLASLAAAIVSFELSSAAPESPIGFWLHVGGLALMFGAFFYFLGSRYITGTSVTDMTYQSHKALSRFLDENAASSSLATFMRGLGPVLFVLALIYGALIGWAQFSGAIK